MAVTVSRDLTVQVLHDINATKLMERQQALRAAIQRGEPKSLGVSRRLSLRLRQGNQKCFMLVCNTHAHNIYTVKTLPTCPIWAVLYVVPCHSGGSGLCRTAVGMGHLLGICMHSPVEVLMKVLSVLFVLYSSKHSSIHMCGIVRHRFFFCCPSRRCTGWTV